MNKYSKTMKFLVTLLTLAAFFSLLAAGCRKSEGQLSCSLPYVNELFFSGGLIYSTYVILCGPDVIESGLQVTEAGTEEVIAQADILRGWAGGLFVEEDIVFIANGDNGLVIIDAGDRQDLKVLGSVDTPGYANAVHVFGGHAYIADGAEGLAVVDISDTENPVMVSSNKTGGYTSDVYVDETSIYIATGDAGLDIIDRSELLGE